MLACLTKTDQAQHTIINSVFQQVRRLLRHLVIYGLGDAATSVASLLLLPLFTYYLKPADYGVITALLIVEAVTRILFRWGTDSAFMRLYYDCANESDQQRLTSTIVWFLLGINFFLLVLGFAGAPLLGRYFFETPVHDGLVRLVIFNTFLSTFQFIPNCLLRLREQSKLFSVLTFIKSAGTIILRLVLVVPLRMGVDGVVLSDTIMAVVMTIVMAPWVLPLLRPVFSRQLLRESLRFGFPRLPHALAHQAIASSDRAILVLFVSMREIGLYGVGASFGMALKLVLNGFEFAWAPFYFGAMKRPDAKQIYSRLTTYVLGVVVFFGAGLSAVAADLVRLMTKPEFQQASVVIPIVVLGVVAQTGYQMTAVGLNITKQTKYFPIATGIAACVSVTANLLLIPTMGFVGAAWANAIAYTTLTLFIGFFSQRVYPVAYEWRRLGLIAGAGIFAYAAARLLVPAQHSAVAGFLMRGTVVTVLYPAVLWIAGFLEAPELRRLISLWASLSTTRRVQATADETAEMGGEIISDSSGRLELDTPNPPTQTDGEPRSGT